MTNTFRPTINIWSLNPKQIASLRPGQWVKAGNQGDKGVFCGVKKSGTVVVAWYENAKRGQGGFRSYVAALMNYAKGV